MALKYRSEIDGLRALSVLGVVAYHAFPSALTGGFVGVDVFFVISGFLITSNILAERAASHFSILGFYEKRCRRLLPALAAMLLVTSVAAILLLPPSELKAYGSSLLWVSGFVSNLHFRHSFFYFAPLAVDQPLLHTWSLAVEEQFYIFWPLILAFIAQASPGRLRPIVWGVTLVSLAASQWELGNAPGGAFYLVPYRAWELGLGALIAVGALPIPGRVARELVSALGLAMIVAAMIVFDGKTPFPGIAAALPCVGAMLFIHATRGDRTLAARLASFRPAVFVGLISYSLYLWHWPVLVLARAAFARPMVGWEAAAAIVVTFILSVLSWRFVERPFRRRGVFTRPQILRMSAGLLATGAAAGLAMVQTGGLEAFASPAVMVAERAKTSFDWTCLSKINSMAPVERTSCTRGSRADGYDVLLWGDSHANHMHLGVAEVAAARGMTVREASEEACKPFFDPALVPIAMTKQCLAFNRAVLAEARADPGLKLVILSARWTKLVEALAGSGNAADRSPTHMAIIFGDALLTMRRQFGPRVRIMVVGSTPEFDVFVASCFARERHQGRTGDHCDHRAPSVADVSADADAAIARAAASVPGTNAMFPQSMMCAAGTCQTIRDGDILLWDDSHLTNEGGRLVAHKLFASL